jgi:hypothetical protein
MSMPNDTNFDPHLYRFIFKGKGMVHVAFPFLNTHPVFYFERNPLPNDPTFRLSDNDYTTTIPSNGKRTVSIGAFNLRDCYVNIRKEVVTQYPSCRMTYFTSHGPTTDGRIKPDIIAPGENVMAPRSRMDDYLGHQFIVDTNTVSFSGTSATSPIVAGAAALLWERFPELVAADIKQLLKNNTQQDGWTAQTGTLPNNIAGWGKLDVFKAMTGITLTDSICFRSDTCQSTLVSNPPAPPPLPEFFWKIYPNPAGYVSDHFMVDYISADPLTMTLFDAQGRLLLQRTLPAVSGFSRFNIPIYAFSSGVYYLRVQSKTHHTTNRLVITR